MDVWNKIRPFGRILWVALTLLTVTCARVQADPMYSIVDLGAGPVTYGQDSSGESTITGANGGTYLFNPAQNYLPAQWSSTNQGVPTPVPAPINSPDTYGNPSFAYTTSTLVTMNSQGLAAGLDNYGVAGHLANTEAFVTQQQPNGSWGTPIPLWSGEPGFGLGGGDVGIQGISRTGQVLGLGYNMGGSSPGLYGEPSGYGMFVYDSKSNSFTSISNLIASIKSPSGQNWFLNDPVGQIDNQGRILIVQNVYENGYGGQTNSLLLVPNGVSAAPIVDEIPAPEPTTWTIFAMLIGGWVACKRLRRHG